MRLLSEPLSNREIKGLLDMLEGNISRICLSNDSEEIMSSLGFAIDRLSTIAYSRIKEINKYDEDEL